MDAEERLKEIKIKLEKSNKYMMFVEYDDIRFLINIIDIMNKRAKMNKSEFNSDSISDKYITELKTTIEKNILNKLEVLTRDCYTCDIDKIKKLSESYKNIKEK